MITNGNDFVNYLVFSVSCLLKVQFVKRIEFISEFSDLDNKGYVDLETTKKALTSFIELNSEA